MKSVTKHRLGPAAWIAVGALVASVAAGCGGSAPKEDTAVNTASSSANNPAYQKATKGK